LQARDRVVVIIFKMTRIKTAFGLSFKCSYSLKNKITCRVCVICERSNCVHQLKQQVLWWHCLKRHNMSHPWHQQCMYCIQYVTGVTHVVHEGSCSTKREQVRNKRFHRLACCSQWGLNKDRTSWLVIYRLSPRSTFSHEDVILLLVLVLCLIPIFALCLLFYEWAVHLILLLNLSQQEMTAHLKGCHHPLQWIGRWTGVNLKAHMCSDRYTHRHVNVCRLIDHYRAKVECNRYKMQTQCSSLPSWDVRAHSCDWSEGHCGVSCLSSQKLLFPRWPLRLHP